MTRNGSGFLLGAALACAVCLAAAPAAGQDLLITGGKLIDPGSGEVTRADLLAVGGTIVAVGEIRLPPDGFAGETLDASGQWIVPGLRDLHVHAFSNRSPGRAAETLTTSEVAERMLHAGVVGFLDLFNLEDYVLLLRDHQRETGEPVGADLYAAGPCLTAPGGHCTEYRIPTRTISTPEDARREIGELVAKRPDVVKLVYAHAPEGVEAGVAETAWNRALPSIDRETLEAAVAAAAEHGLPTVVHVRSWRDVREAAEAGATAVTHVPAEKMPDDLPGLLAERGTVMIPTLANLDTALATEPELLKDPLLASLTTGEVLAAYREFPTAGDPERAERILRSMTGAQERRLVSVGELADAGVPIVAGTDSGNPWTVQGFSLHRELELMVRAGLEPMAALRAATTAAGDLLGYSWGLAPGDPADLLILDASPLDDVRNTRKIHTVVHHGRRIDRAAPAAGPPP